jgi:hypothetical protein
MEDHYNTSYSLLAESRTYNHVIFLGIRLAPTELAPNPLLPYTVELRFTNASNHEQIFRKKSLG